MERVRLSNEESQNKPEEADRASKDSQARNSQISEKDIKRLRKLFALIGDSSAAEGEAGNAFRHVRKILKRYGRVDVNALYVKLGGSAADTAPVDDIDVWPYPVDGKELLRELRRKLKLHIIMTAHQRLAVVLWVLHAHCHDAARISAILLITAPTQECGKTQVLEFVGRVTPSPFATTDTTAAALVDEIEFGYPCTCLIDEADSFMAAGSAATLMRNVLNSGHKRGGYTRRKTGKYSTWAPKAIGLNGNLHPTLESRCINIRMERKRPDEIVEPMGDERPGDEDDEFNVLRRKCARWTKDNIDALPNAKPDMPRWLDGARGMDNWLPLLAIADRCGLSKEARKAAVALAEQKSRVIPLKEQLLADLHDLFKTKSAMASQDIVERLVALELGPWAEFRNGRPLTTKALAQLLLQFNVRPVELRFTSGRRANGYRREQLGDVFSRYLRK